MGGREGGIERRGRMEAEGWGRREGRGVNGRSG